MAEDCDHIGKVHGHAACRGLVCGAGEVQEDCAAGAWNDGIVIMAEHDHHIIEMIGPPHGLSARAMGKRDGPIVSGIGRIVAPAVFWSNNRQGQGGRRRC